jgi:hypothetical protein
MRLSHSPQPSVITAHKVIWKIMRRLAGVYLWRMDKSEKNSQRCQLYEKGREVMEERRSFSGKKSSDKRKKIKKIQKKMGKAGPEIFSPPDNASPPSGPCTSSFSAVVTVEHSNIIRKILLNAVVK